MLRPNVTALTLLALAGLAACGSETTNVAPDATPTPDAAPDVAAPDAEPPADAAPDATPTPDAEPPADVAPAPDADPPADVPEPPPDTSPCDMVAAGTVSGFMVDGMARSFIVTLPTGATGAGGRWPLVFAWHGFGDNAASFNALLSRDVNNAAMPFILVTPSSTMLGPTTMPVGIDWDELRYTVPNREARLFDAIVRCVDARWGIDRDRVYTAGFSAGAIMSDLLGVVRGDQLAAVASFSGGYFSNPANPATLGVFRAFVSWPALTTRNRYPQLVVYGGASDMFSLVVAAAHFDQFAANDIPYLRAAGHDVVDCGHGGGHTVPTAMRSQVIPFFAAHPRGLATSPWRTALPAGMPSYCTFRAAGM